jgi:hypothetical protein
MNHPEEKAVDQALEQKVELQETSGDVAAPLVVVGDNESSAQVEQPLNQSTVSSTLPPSTVPRIRSLKPPSNHRQVSNSKREPWFEQPQFDRENLRKIPLFYPGVVAAILGGITSLTMVKPLPIIGTGNLYWLLGCLWASTQLACNVYWAFCIFRLSGFLNYRSKKSKIFTRTLACLVPLVSTPFNLFTFTGAGMGFGASIGALIFVCSHNYAVAHHASSPLSIAVITLLVVCLAVVPMFLIPGVVIAWLYQIVVRAYYAFHGDQASFWRARIPALIIIASVLVPILVMLTGALSMMSNDPTPTPIYFQWLTWGFIGSNIGMAVAFYTLRRLAKSDTGSKD